MQTLVPDGSALRRVVVGEVVVPDLVVVARDFDGNLVPDAVVVFEIHRNTSNGQFPGGSSTEPATTKGDGKATAPTLTADDEVGGFTVHVTAQDGPGATDFTITVYSDPPPQPRVETLTPSGAGGTREVPAGGAVYPDLAVIAQDFNGNPVPDADVKFTVRPGTSSGSFPGPHPTACATTDDDGEATAPHLTADNGVGGFTVHVTPANGPAAFDFTVTVEEERA
ncbi:hypothetical protein AB0I60_34440 [Actinosynnema sp. NPDC050436]|uniref:hypothetical protein n=1 Tax=Actinosynnema sp. NPDC050436 TaxID=3155659 RepID=UPI0033D481A2